jgi:hypothetical protein
VADEGDRDRAHKRGGGRLVPLECSSGEARYQREPAHDETPEQIFERRWAFALIDRVLDRLRNEFVQHGQPEHFDRLKACLLGRSEVPYAALAREMKTPEGALKVAIHRFRKRYRELFRQEIADTVGDPADVESELRSLAAVLSRKDGGTLWLFRRRSWRTFAGFCSRSSAVRRSAWPALPIHCAQALPRPARRAIRSGPMWPVVRQCHA